MDSNELDILFKSDKTNWYTTNINGSKIWNKEKLNLFWAMIKIHKILKNDLEFNGFIFPSFYKNPLFLNTDAIYFFEVFGAAGIDIQKKIRFINCTFLGDFLFNNFKHTTPTTLNRNINLNNDLSFINCNFLDKFRLVSVNISERLAIHECTFENEFLLMESKILNQLSIYKCDFNKKTTFWRNQIKRTNFSGNNFNALSQLSNSTYTDSFSLDSCTFNNKTEFNNNNYNKAFSIHSTKFNRTVIFQAEKFQNGSFKDINFSKEHSYIKDISLTANSFLSLRNNYFPSNFSFIKSNCTNILFMESTVEHVKFDSCTWNITNRLLIKDETDLENLSISNYLKLEQIYRQLKKNFDGQKDWELSGYAYISEMEMRKKRLFLEKKWFSFFIYWFYGFFGGYTQDFLRPIKSLFLLIFISTIAYFFIDYNLINALERGANGSIPYIEIREDEPYPGYWLLLKNIQLILGGIFISFFILGLRKRFKQ
ncbi:hypothetical protein [uncultured Lacinutrix sp.]|uniref:hypothetical protein n=1 Tax=uncultured Lacinutrix sp. TaxID=574032 RepID=UPI0026157FE1|nr:hypothetical protein [uncultured Lacinutrix sp.]